VSIGEVLTNARRRAGLSVTQVSRQTRIRETIITDIESDDYSACGGDFYARGHIRSIARVVGVDPAPLIEAYDSARPGPPRLAEDATEPLPTLRMSQHRRPDPITHAQRLPQAPPAGPGAPPGRHQRRRRPTWAAALGVALVAGLGFGGYLLASAEPGAAPAAGARPAASRHAGRASDAATAPATATQGAHPTPAFSTPAAAPPMVLTPARATAFGAPGGPGDNSGVAQLAIDGNPATAWHTDWYTTARFGNLYPGTGLLVDMGRPVTITAARITLGRAHGATFQLRAGAAPALASLRPVAHAANAGGVVQLRLTRPAHARYLLVWFTSLPRDPAGTFQASVYGLRLEGRT
jgi:hypothetical protein